MVFVVCAFIYISAQIEYDVLEDNIFASLNDKSLTIDLESASSKKETTTLPKKQGGKKKIFKCIKISLNRKNYFKGVTPSPSSSTLHLSEKSTEKNRFRKNIIKKYPRNTRRFTKKKNRQVSHKK